VKDPVEIPFIKEAQNKPKSAMKAALEAAKPGMTERELESVARRKMLELGPRARRIPRGCVFRSEYPLRPVPFHGQAASGKRAGPIHFWGEVQGYCGNMCPPFAFGKVPGPAKSSWKQPSRPPPTRIPR
jgi:Xaa-Pro aminopeptidase